MIRFPYAAAGFVIAAALAACSSANTGSVVPPPPPTATPVSSPGASPTASPSASPTASPSASPTNSSAPAANAVVNGDFETGSLAPWTACSYAHAAYEAAVDPSPAPAATGTQPPGVTGPASASDLAAYAAVTAPPQNWNPDHVSDATGNLGSYAALTGSPQGQLGSPTGICQTVTVPADGTLSFWVYEGGTNYGFWAADDDALLLDGSGTTIVHPLFVELNCYYDSLHLGVVTGNETSGCMPSAYGGDPSGYHDWQGGYWTERGPYDLSAYAGQTLTLYLGVWGSHADAIPSDYDQFMYVDNVTLRNGSAATPMPSPMASAPFTIQGGSHR